MATVALVTGGGSGIGRGIALALARRGMSVAVAGRRAHLLEQVEAEIAGLGGKGVAIAADLSIRAERPRLLSEVNQALGPVAFLVNSAAQFNGGELACLSRAEVMQSLAVNLEAVIDLTYLALPDLKRQQGRVVLLGSNASFMPLPFAALYSATKAGLRAFGESLRYELEGTGVHVLLVFPPDTATAMTRPMAEASGVSAYPLASADAVGERIAAAVERCEPVVSWGWRERSLAGLYCAAPWLVTWLFRAQRARFARMMAATRGRQGDDG